MKNFTLLFLLILSFSINSMAQEKGSDKIAPPYSFYLGGFGGVATYFGDLSDNPLDQVSELHPAFGVYLRFNYDEYFSARFTATYGRVSGKDSNSEESWRRLRNLSFRSPVAEVALIPEFNVYDIVLPSSGYVITPYVFAGVAGFFFNPQAELDGVWTNLQPLGTEGQGIPGYEAKYKQIALAIPYGIGVKFKLSPHTTFTWETGFRYTMTDYLDDVHLLYPDMTLLGEVNGLDAVRLSDRTAEYTGIQVTKPAGSLRSNGEVTDFYFFSGLSFSVNLSSKVKP